jgi:hypothetical protein
MVCQRTVLALWLWNVAAAAATNCTCSPFSGNQGACCKGNNECSHLKSSTTCGGDTPVCCNSDFSSHCCPPASACTQGCRDSILGACGCIPRRASAYAEEHALYSLAFVAASQCTPAGGLSDLWNCTACPQSMPLELVRVVQAAGHQTLVGFDAAANQVVVALRGSLSLQVRAARPSQPQFLTVSSAH